MKENTRPEFKNSQQWSWWYMRRDLMSVRFHPSETNHLRTKHGRLLLKKFISKLQQILDWYEEEYGQ